MKLIHRKTGYRCWSGSFNTSSLSEISNYDVILESGPRAGQTDEDRERGYIL